MYQQLPTADNGYHAPRSCTSCQNMSKLTWKVSSKLSFGCPFRHALTKPWLFTAFHRPLRPLRPCDGFFALPEVGSCGWVPSAEAAAQCDAGDVWRPGNRGMAFVCLIKYVLRIRYAAKSKYWVLSIVDGFCWSSLWQQRALWNIVMSCPHFPRCKVTSCHQFSHQQTVLLVQRLDIEAL